MKKRMVLAVVSLISALILGVMLAACSTSVVGTYKFVSTVTTVNGEVTEEVKVGDTQGGLTVTADFMVIELKEDNTFTMTQVGYEQTGTWEQDGNKITLTITGISEKGELTVSGNTLTITTSYGTGATAATSVTTLKK